MNKLLSHFRDGFLKAGAVAKRALNDAMMKGMIPLFVEDRSPDDHKCGICFMRIVGSGDAGTCTVKTGPISMKKGTCLFWEKGPASAPSKVHPQRMSNGQAGYVEYDGKVQCGTCVHFNKDYSDDEGRKYCALWDSLVFAEQCCIAWANPEEETPGRS